MCICDWCGVLCCMSRWMIGLLIFPLAEHKSLFYPPSLNLYRVKCLCSQLLSERACVCVCMREWGRKGATDSHQHQLNICLCRKVMSLSFTEQRCAFGVVTAIDSSVGVFVGGVLWTGWYMGWGSCQKKGGAKWIACRTFVLPVMHRENSGWWPKND